MADEAFPYSDVFDDDVHYADSIAFLEIVNENHEAIQDISIYPGRDIRVGRDSKCYHRIDDPRVSKQHFRIYSIIYEQGQAQEIPPLVYCEDLESSNGTYINGVLIGIIGRERIGHLLSDGDVIEIRPFWRFLFHQPSYDTVSRSTTELNDLQERYTVSDRILGKGHFGAVYLAKETSTLKQMACKIVNLDVASKKHTQRKSYPEEIQSWDVQLRRAAEGRQMATREIKILSRLDHPHIINLKKAFCGKDMLYIFTDLAPGGDLFSYLESNSGTLEDWHARVISRQVVLAIKFMHSKGIAHRDIKPENVLIMQTDYGGRVVLTDFGLANSVDTRTGRLKSIVGSEGFIAPEVEEDKGYTMAVDLWSLGVLTACLLTGNSMIPRDELSQLSQVQIANRFLAINDTCQRDRWTTLSEGAQRFLRDLFVMDPAKRMTASDALEHPWYKKPTSEAVLLEDRYHKIIRFWKKRNEDEQVIENLPGRILPQADARVGPKLRRKLPDVSQSPYFSLDRHLYQRPQPTRRTILETLHESGSHFLPSEGVNIDLGHTVARKERDVRVISVSAKDLFGMSQQMDPVTQSEPIIQSKGDLCEVLVDLTRDASTSGIELSAASSRDVFENSSAEESHAKSQEHGDRKRKRSRKESWDPEDRRIHSNVSKALPPYTSAKIFKDAIAKEKQKARRESKKRGF
ncbi:hypothetical protein G7Y89_g9659 [Cudoniella acicularis]|uniref:Uncharacterized protein n=1 Tax=Cudoniella acicularis TaxID=354080 RepID=A0A8H4VZF6_9HELO|nr:hypothetical protein G7Y89_g9659 [Cudoniella acicularis]